MLCVWLCVWSVVYYFHFLSYIVNVKLEQLDVHVINFRTTEWLMLEGTSLLKRARFTWFPSDNSNLSVLIVGLSIPTFVQTGPVMKQRLYRIKNKFKKSIVQTTNKMRKTILTFDCCRRLQQHTVTKYDHLRSFSKHFRCSVFPLSTINFSVAFSSPSLPVRSLS